MNVTAISIGTMARPSGAVISLRVETEPGGGLEGFTMVFTPREARELAEQLISQAYLIDRKSLQEFVRDHPQTPEDRQRQTEIPPTPPEVTK